MSKQALNYLLGELERLGTSSASPDRTTAGRGASREARTRSPAWSWRSAIEAEWTTALRRRVRRALGRSSSSERSARRGRCGRACRTLEIDTGHPVGGVVGQSIEIGAD